MTFRLESWSFYHSAIKKFNRILLLLQFLQSDLWVHYNFCFRLNKDDILVKLGKYDFEKEEETGSSNRTFRVKSLKTHENYNEETFANDIAIIKLDKPATLSDSVWPICLPTAGESFTNRRCFVIGKLEGVEKKTTFLFWSDRSFEKTIFQKFKNRGYKPTAFERLIFWNSVLGEQQLTVRSTLKGCFLYQQTPFGNLLW